jgi:hypothetical protein
VITSIEEDAIHSHLWLLFSIDLEYTHCTASYIEYATIMHK